MPSEYYEEQVLKVTQDYKLIVGVTDIVPDMKGRRTYMVVNTKFDIIEALGPVYPYALKTIIDLQADIDALREEERLVSQSRAH